MAQISAKSKEHNAGDLSYEFPKSELITIDKANLQIQLDKFKQAILSKNTTDKYISFIILAFSFWTPMYTSDFKPVMGIPVHIVFSVYVGFGTFFSLFFLFKYILSPLIFFIKNKDKISTDSEKMSQTILDKCNKKN